MQDAKYPDCICLYPVGDDVRGSLDNQFASAFYATGATYLRKSYQARDGIPDALIDEDGSARTIRIDVVVNFVAVRLCVRGPL
jgi:hypothetical protein